MNHSNSWIIIKKKSVKSHDYLHSDETSYKKYHSHLKIILFQGRRGEILDSAHFPKSDQMTRHQNFIKEFLLDLTNNFSVPPQINNKIAL